MPAKGGSEGCLIEEGIKFVCSHGFLIQILCLQGREEILMKGGEFGVLEKWHGGFSQWFSD